MYTTEKMSCDGVQKKYKKRTIANLLQTDTSTVISNEKKTYIKEYFEHSPPKTPDSLNESNMSLSVDTNSGEFLSPTSEKDEPTLTTTATITIVKKSKVKDYVFEPHALTAEAKALATISNEGGTRSPSQLQQQQATNESSILKSIIQRKRISRARARKSKIKDYIVDENVIVPATDSPIQLVPSKNWIKVPIIKPKIIQISKISSLGSAQTQTEISTLTNACSAIRHNSSKLKSKRNAKPKIKDYMLKETPSALTKPIQSTTLQQASLTAISTGNSSGVIKKRVISNMIKPKPVGDVIAIYPSSKIPIRQYTNSTNKGETNSTKETRRNKKITHLFADQKLKSSSTTTKVERANETSSSQHQAKGTIKDYLDRTPFTSCQSKCSRAKLIKNKENLNQLKTVESQFY